MRLFTPAELSDSIVGEVVSIVRRQRSWAFCRFIGARLVSPFTRKKDHVHAVCLFVHGVRPAWYFVKIRPFGFNRTLEQFLGDEGLCVPRLVGVGEAEGRKIGVWTFVKGRFASFDPGSPGELEGLIRAVAEISLPDMPVNVRASLPASTPWLTRQHAGVLERLGYIPSVLTHHDIKRYNVLVSRTGKRWILDWDSARMDAAGASLRLISLIGDPDTRHRLFSLYASEVSHRGIRLTVVVE